jgi:hypothetical protein
VVSAAFKIKLTEKTFQDRWSFFGIFVATCSKEDFKESGRFYIF